MRKPDVIIGEPTDPYLLRWWVIPRNRFFNIYLHKFCKSDDDRALHDHPWLFNCSILLKGSYLEWKFAKPHKLNKFLWGYKAFKRRRFIPYFRWGKAPHRVELPNFAIKNGISQYNTYKIPCWTIFITGPTVREWGFHCPQGWKPWKEFVTMTDKGSKTGRGCN